MKKFMVIIFTLSLVLGLAAAVGAADYKIGIMTGTVSQGEEEFMAAQDMIDKYGDDVITHRTYPDKFMDEQETTITQIVSMASDPEVKVIVICQAVPGTSAAIERVKEFRPDMFFIAGVPHEDPLMIADKADIVLETDNLKRGETIVKLAHKMGAEKFLHYSFPRHMSYELLSRRRDIFKETCEELGMEFIEATAPDPTGDAGIPGTQQYILEDVPRQVEKHGKNVAFFSTNCSMQEPLIRKTLDEGAIYPEQCCPSPYHAMPGALGIEIPSDRAGDVEYLLNEIREKVGEKDGNGRVATWKVPANMAMVRSATEYAVRYAEGEVNGYDFDVMYDVLKEVAGNVELNKYEEADNFLMFVAESEIF
ncbi:MAG: DUF3798 domain-containing protein [Halanaerobiales bacterium]